MFWLDEELCSDIFLDGWLLRLFLDGSRLVVAFLLPGLTI